MGKVLATQGKGPELGPKAECISVTPALGDTDKWVLI